MTLKKRPPGKFDGNSTQSHTVLIYMTNKSMISVVFPAYNEEGNVEELHRRILEVMHNLERPFEIIAVDNGSVDLTPEKLKNLSPIKIISFLKNCGQTAALDASIHAAKGDIVVTMDADLQNDPRDIPKMLEKLDEGYDVVAGWRKERRDSFGRRFLSRLANWLTSRVTGIYLHDYACALKMFRKKFIGDIHLYGEMHVFLPAILASRGARVAEVMVRHYERRSGISKHYFMKAVKDIADLLTVKFLFSYAARPLLFFGGWGSVNVIVAFICAIAAVASTFVQGIHIIDSPFTLLAIMFLILGFILIMMGFLAELILRVYYESRGETPYIISEIIEQ